MTKERLNPLNDFLFLKTMGEKGDEEQLLGFLNAVLGRAGDNKLQSVEILENRIITPEIMGDKTSVLDVLAQTESGTRVNIEVQLQNLGDMDRRSLFYWSREYSKQLKAGEKYIELPNVISINIINFEYINSKNFHACFHLWEDTEKDIKLTNALEIHFIDMVKFRRLGYNSEEGSKGFLDNPLNRWLTFFERSSPNELIEEVLKMDVAIRKANDMIDIVTMDEAAYREYLAREKDMLNRNSVIYYYTREAKKEVAQKMKADNLPISQIIEYTGLTEKQVLDL
jgi:predicted transposase/invertase (TIGR01784 family)